MYAGMSRHSRSPNVESWSALRPMAPIEAGRCEMSWCRPRDTIHSHTDVDLSETLATRTVSTTDARQAG